MFRCTKVRTGSVLACVAVVKRGREGGIWVREGEMKGTPAGLQRDHCFLHFSRSDFERENSDWSELIKCQSSTSFFRLVENNITPFKYLNIRC